MPKWQPCERDASCPYGLSVCPSVRHISTSDFASTATETAVFALFLPVQPSNRYYMVQMDFLTAHHVCIVGLCSYAHRAVIFAIAQLSCFIASRSQRVSLIVIPFCLSVCRSFRDLQATTIDRSQPNLVGMYIPASDPCKPFWIPYLPYFRCQREKYAKFRLFPSERDASCHMTCFWTFVILLQAYRPLQQIM